LKEKEKVFDSFEKNSNLEIKDLKNKIIHLDIELGDQLNLC
jgi:hypothetical protein